MAVLRNAVLLTVFFLCIQFYVGSIACLKHPRFIQLLDASREGYGLTNVCKVKITFSYTQYLFSKSETLFISIIFKVYSWGFSPLDILLGIFLLLFKKDPMGSFHP